VLGAVALVQGDDAVKVLSTAPVDELVDSPNASL